MWRGGVNILSTIKNISKPTTKDWSYYSIDKADINNTPYWLHLLKNFQSGETNYTIYLSCDNISKLYLRNLMYFTSFNDNNAMSKLITIGTKDIPNVCVDPQFHIGYYNYNKTIYLGLRGSNKDIKRIYKSYTLNLNTLYCFSSIIDFKSKIYTLYINDKTILSTNLTNYPDTFSIKYFGINIWAGSTNYTNNYFLLVDRNPVIPDNPYDICMPWLDDYYNIYEANNNLYSIGE